MPGTSKHLELLGLLGRFKHLPSLIDGAMEVVVTAQDQDRAIDIINVINRLQLIGSHSDAWFELT